MQFDDFELIKKVCHNLGYEYSIKGVVDLFEELNSDEYHKYAARKHSLYRPMVPKLKRQLEALAGPYGKVIFKMIKLKQAEKK